MKKRKTLVDVAAAAGVSKMTASRALRGDKDVSDANVEKVKRAAREIGYYGNHLAASLSSKRTDLIGVVVPSLSNIVFPQVMSGVTDALKGSTLQPVFGVTDYDPEAEYDIIRNMLSWRPAGLIVAGLDQPDDTRSLLADAGIPIVQIMDCDGDPVDACVGFSQTGAGRDMATALLATGRWRFGYVGRNLDKDLRAAKRKKGFQDALRDQGLDFIDTIDGSHLESDEATLSAIACGRFMTADLLARQPDLDCIHFSNDDLAFGGLCHCIAANIDVPGTVALSGFNGLGLLDGFPGKIATSRTARREIGETAARVILETIEGTKTESDKIHILTPTISLGDLAVTAE
ncbi:MAG TPA: LacI family DNA-binding transcriptional regulator [Sulfitobacter pontiacus]|uniref:LacI family DNA-binding transcriptional regulator n=1 Tax=Sulfitobacter TaxID=60136 RepID=UPI000066D198|nr:MULTISPECIES: LacI family DNA-binding transcriptional regulator [unclassified Sulfitobacter]MAJ79678.1 LacI family transcriptional regulator [Roseobacter sp.]HBR36228.1 LacI family DNA-binding transcriptional regulator [Sulfitobacter pontiacus]AXI50495.1 LacI family DNA-binding transcriptional regulator [Sulfitobacter sp. SK025]EAP79385.1 transcriptional regulator, LacI family protein [Sulfitobacter sp. NAS-14.1]OUT34886.1 MAG: LacI family transcriptional regulator [Sulfitobacter sp. TMED3]